MASWYGPDFNGRLTSSGRVYDMYQRTAAHPYLPFGTILKVVNIENGLSTTVIVNDRGPFKKGRGLDLSYRAAKDIGLIGHGTAMVRLRVLGRDPSYMRSVRYGPMPPHGPYTIQVGSFGDSSNALRLKAVLEMKYANVYINRIFVRHGKKVFYRVNVGRFSDRKDADLVATRLAIEGYGALITGYRPQKTMPVKKVRYH
ncbi:MAG: septal ring lytic transglycosylase RlpA family protein [Nitrospiraceae bacterium]|nr:septal ring lytic transglycosylase RlpA family protein [Nitrospiraceae bacterium]MDA8089621.1 septal ring lytic transglycosylase RlpA family protein [Nitrospiraceae bacterium]